MLMSQMSTFPTMAGFLYFLKMAVQNHGRNKSDELSHMLLYKKKTFEIFEKYFLKSYHASFDAMFCSKFCTKY